MRIDHVLDLDVEYVQTNEHACTVKERLHKSLSLICTYVVLFKPFNHMLQVQALVASTKYKPSHNPKGVRKNSKKRN